MNRVLHVMKIALPDPSKSLRIYSIGLSSNSSSSTAIKHKSSIHVFFFLSCYLLLMTTFGRAIFSHMFFNASSLSKIGLSVSNRTKIVNTAKALQINYTKKKSQDSCPTSCSNMSLTPSYFNSLPVVVRRLTIIGTN